MIPTHKIATSGLKIYITETLFFKDGEAMELFLNKDYEVNTAAHRILQSGESRRIN